MAKRKATQNRLAGFAEDLGKFFGTTEARTKAWVAERQHILGQLTAVRDRASELIQSLSGESRTAGAATRGGRTPGRQAGTQSTTGKKRGRPKGSKMSAEARAKIAAAQKRRWAKARKAAKQE